MIALRWPSVTTASWLPNLWGSPGCSTVKNLPVKREIRVWSLGREDLLVKKTATHPSILAWKIPWTKQPGGLQLMGLQRVGHDLATKQQTISLLYILMNELLQKCYGIQYYSHTHNAVLETLLPYLKKKHLPGMIDWYAVSPIVRERSALYGKVILWKKRFKTVRKLAHY